MIDLSFKTDSSHSGVKQIVVLASDNAVFKLELSMRTQNGRV
jgi:hypothetical protein